MAGPSNGPLEGIRVAEFGTGAALAYCGKLFADFGANVVKVEAPGGNPARQSPPLIDRGDGVMESGVFAWLNTNKQSVTATDQDADRLREIAGASDVLIDSRPDAGSDSGSTGHASLRAAFPHLHIVAISWFGENGPYKDFIPSDGVVRALAGCVKMTGSAEQPGLLAEHQAGIPAALNGFAAAMAAILNGSEKGRRFEISVHEANVLLMDYQTSALVQAGMCDWRTGVNQWYPTFPVGVYPCKEGWLGITALTTDQWQGFCDMLGMDEEAANPVYALSTDRLALAEELEAVFVPRLQAKTAKEWFQISKRLKVPCAVVPTMGELLETPVHRVRDAFSRIRVGTAEFEAPTLPQRLTETPPAKVSEAPLAGVNTETWRPAPSVLNRKPRTGLPLEGVRIIDLAMGWAGPLATRQAADLGAEVIKVEGRAYPDWWRGTPYTEAEIAENIFEMASNFSFVNRNKTGITLDLTQPAGADLLRRLVQTADAVVDNYSQEVLPKLGLDYDNLRKVKPDLVMVSMPAFGSKSEWADVRAYGTTLEHASGLPLVSGLPEWAPTMNHMAYGDPTGGMNSAAALLVALFHKQRTGQGQFVDLSQVECMFPLAAPWIIEQSITGKVGPRLGNRHPVMAPHGVFQCDGADEWVVVAVTTDAAWRSLCGVIGRADLAADASLATVEGRRAQQDRLEAAIGEWTRTRGPDEAMNLLQSAGVSAGVARGFRELLEAEPHLQARGYWQTIDRAYLGPYPQPSPTFREEGKVYPIRLAAPTLGQSTREVLTRILGLDQAELDRLETERVIGERPIPFSERQPRSAAVMLAAAKADA